MGELHVDPKVLKQAADGINGITGELGKLGISETASVGRGFSMLTLSPMEAGKQPVQNSFEGFCERWSWGVRALVQAANAIAKMLGLSAGRYHQMEQIASGTFKQMWTHLAGNPQLSKDEARNRSWSQTVADNPVNQLMHPDYSRKSFQQLQQTAGTNWKVVKTVGPQAAANLGLLTAPYLSLPAAGAGVGPPPGWNTGAADQAAKIMQEGKPPAPAPAQAGGE